MVRSDVLISLAAPALFILFRGWLSSASGLGVEWVFLVGLLLPFATLYLRRQVAALNAEEQAEQQAIEHLAERRKKLRPSAALVDALESNIPMDGAERESSRSEKKKKKRKASRKERRDKERAQTNKGFVSWVNDTAARNADLAKEKGCVLVLARYHNELTNSDVSMVRLDPLPAGVQSLADLSSEQLRELVDRAHNQLLLEREGSLQCAVCSKAAACFCVYPSVFKTFVLLHPCVPLCEEEECALSAAEFLKALRQPKE